MNSAIDPDTPLDHGSVQAVTQRPERSIADVLESRNSRLADFVQRNPTIAKALGKVVAGVDHFCIRHGVPPALVRIEAVETHPRPGGADIVIKLRKGIRLT